jgi:hypothetical protein
LVYSQDPNEQEEGHVDHHIIILGLPMTISYWRPEGERRTKRQTMIKSIKEGDNVAIQLLDDGCSIPLGIIDKIFAPIGKGTTFTLLLPIKHSC